MSVQRHLRGLLLIPYYVSVSVIEASAGNPSGLRRCQALTEKTDFFAAAGPRNARAPCELWTWPRRLGSRLSCRVGDVSCPTLAFLSGLWMPVALRFLSRWLEHFQESRLSHPCPGHSGDPDDAALGPPQPRRAIPAWPEAQISATVRPYGMLCMWRRSIEISRLTGTASGSFRST